MGWVVLSEHNNKCLFYQLFEKGISFEWLLYQIHAHCGFGHLLHGCFFIERLKSPVFIEHTAKYVLVVSNTPLQEHVSFLSKLNSAQHPHNVESLNRSAVCIRERSFQIQLDVEEQVVLGR